MEWLKLQNNQKSDILMGYNTGKVPMDRNHLRPIVASVEEFIDEAYNLCMADQKIRELKKQNPFLDELKPLDLSLLAEYEREMEEEGIPEIIKSVGRRKVLAVDARQRLI